MAVNRMPDVFQFQMDKNLSFWKVYTLVIILYNWGQVQPRKERTGRRNYMNEILPKNDILYKSENMIFSYRVGGILRQNGKILLQRPRNDDYAIIGGHVTSFETTKETLIREFEEELHVRIEVDELLAVGEIFFPWGERPCHQICFYYNVHLIDDKLIPMDGIFHGYDELDNERIDLDFCWVSLDELKNGIKVYPLELIPHITSGSKDMLHFVSKEI